MLLATAGYSMVSRLVIRGTGQGSPQAILPPSSDYELVSLRTKDDTKIVAQFGKAKSQSGALLADHCQRPTAIYCYPGGGNMRWSAPQFDGFRRLGLNVVMPEYPGFGMSDGRPAESGCYGAADAAYDYVLSRSDLSHSPPFAAGWSVGGAAAVDLASRRRVAGLIMVETLPNWNESGRYFARNGAARLPGMPSWAAVALRSIPSWALGLLVSEPKLNSLAKVSLVSSPILMVFGTQSELVSKEMTDRLAAAAKTEVTLLPVEGAGHFDVFTTGGTGLWQSINDWIASHR